MYEEEIKKILEVSKGKFYVNQEEFFDAQNSMAVYLNNYKNLKALLEDNFRLVFTKINDVKLVKNQNSIKSMNKFYTRMQRNF